MLWIWLLSRPREKFKTPLLTAFSPYLWHVMLETNWALYQKWHYYSLNVAYCHPLMIFNIDCFSELDSLFNMPSSKLKSQRLRSMIVSYYSLSYIIWQFKFNNFRIPGHSFASHWITTVTFVFWLVPLKVEVDNSDWVFCSFFGITMDNPLPHFPNWCLILARTKMPRHSPRACIVTSLPSPSRKRVWYM